MTSSPSTWSQRYEEQRPHLEILTRKLDDLIHDLLHEANIPFIQVESRVKAVESFNEKLERKGDKYSNPLEDMTDLIGLRIITSFHEDVRRIGAVLEREFCIDKENSVMKGADYDPDRFGYRSDQYIVSLKENRRDLPEWHRLPSVRWEVQVRTALQHAWAAVEHKLSYKTANTAPAEVKRRLFALSAVFELADREFSSIRDTQDAIAREYAGDVSTDKFDIPMDSASLGAYLDLHEYPHKLRELVAQENAMVPAQHRRVIEYSRSNLVQLARELDFDSIAEFHDYLKTSVEPVLRTVGEFARPHESRYAFEDYLQEAMLISKDISESYFYALGYNEQEWPVYRTNRDTYLRASSRQ